MPKRTVPIGTEGEKMIIGIDIDDTIAQTTEQIDIFAKEYTEKKLNRKFKINDGFIYDPMWAKYVYGWTIDEDKEFWDLYYEEVIGNVKPKKDSREVINNLYKNNEIIIISARWEKKSNMVNKTTIEWLKKYDIKYHKLYLGHEDKRDIVKENNIDLFIDDSIKIYDEIQSLGIQTFLMTSRQNKDIDVKKIIRVNNWKEVYEKICAIGDGSFWHKK